MKTTHKSVRMIARFLAIASSGVCAIDACLAQPDRPALSIRTSQVELWWDTTTNAWDQLQYRSTLTTNQWAPLTPWLLGDAGRFCTNDAVPAGQAQRFYQVVRTSAPPWPSLHFDGGDLVGISNSPSLNATQLTVEASVRLDRVPPIGYWDNQSILVKGDDRTVGSFYLFNNHDQFQFYVGANGVDQAYVATPSIIITSRWYHVAATYDGQVLKIYLDGTLQGTCDAVVSVGNDRPLYFGYHPMSGWEYWLGGSLAEVRLWSVARTENAIRADMNRVLSGSETGLVGCWHFDEGAGQIAHDVTANGNHGQMGSSSSADSDDPAWIPGL